MSAERAQENDMAALPEHPVAFEDEGMGTEEYVAGWRHPVKSLTNRDRSDTSSTCSLTSDVLRFPTEHGRQYHAYSPGRYHRPNDKESFARSLQGYTCLTSF